MLIFLKISGIVSKTSKTVKTCLCAISFYFRKILFPYICMCPNMMNKICVPENDLSRYYIFHYFLLYFLKLVFFELMNKQNHNNMKIYWIFDIHPHIKVNKQHTVQCETFKNVNEWNFRLKYLKIKLESLLTYPQTFNIF